MTPMLTPDDSVTAFLRARLDEDEAAARRVDGAWQEEPESIGVILVNGEPLIEGHITGLTAHIARHDPARVLREVEAGRALLAALEAAQREQPVPGSFGDDPYDPAVSFSAGEYAGLLAAAKCRAAVYSDHPDYWPEWAVSSAGRA